MTYGIQIWLFNYFLIEVSLDSFTDIFKVGRCALATVLTGKQDVHMAVIAKGGR